jgi:predicted transcriptional regulator
MAENEQADLTTLTVELLSAFVANNTIDSAELAGLIQSTHTALSGINAPVAVEPPAPTFEPAVTVRKSLASRDHILSLIDGKPYKTLKRHLSGHGLTPAEYRERYKLAADYPMVAPSYSEHRRAVAERLGLGRKPANAPKAESDVANISAISETDIKPVVATPAKAPRKSTPKPPIDAKTKTPVKRAAKAMAPVASVTEKEPDVKTAETGGASTTAEPKAPSKRAAKTAVLAAPVADEKVAVESAKSSLASASRKTAKVPVAKAAASPKATKVKPVTPTKAKAAAKPAKRGVTKASPPTE